jgi:LPXTG-site transpeptidase (sortase) family protein
MAAPPSPSPTDNEPVPAEQGSRTSPVTICAAAALVLAMGLIGGHGTSSDASRTPPAPLRAEAAPASPAGGPAGKHLQRSRPLRLLIPKIWVDAPFTDLTMGSDGQLQPPPAHDTNVVGWYAAGASPGEAGTAIIAGHLDTTTSAAVFANLGELQKGDVFSVVRADGHTASFGVDSVKTFAKDRFPSKSVYGDTPQAEVRLITCAGEYDRTARDYTDNLVVFAHLV